MIRTFDDNLNIIAALDDEPNDVGGLTAAELKARFDAAGLAVQSYINERLIPDLKAKNLPFSETSGIPAATVQAAIENVQSQIAQVVMGTIPDGSITPDKLSGVARRFYLRFDRADWAQFDGGYQIQIPYATHRLDAGVPMCAYQLHMQVGKNAEDYTGATIAEGQAKFLAAVTAAKSANDAKAGTYPTAADGHIILTWYQLQYYLLTGTLASASTAQSQAAVQGYEWKNTVTQRPSGTVHTLDELLTAAYTPMLGGSTANFNALFTVDTAWGLGFRRKIDTEEAGANAEFDLFGAMRGNTWGCIETEVSLEQGGALTLTSGTAYTGELLVLG